MNRRFSVLMAAETISAMGSQVTLVAIPLTAAIALHAAPFEMGLLQAAITLPPVIFGIFVGVFVDRLPKRMILICSNAICAIVMAFIPISAHLHMLGFVLLLSVSFVAKSVSLFVAIATTSFIPFIVGRDDLKLANSRLGTVLSIAPMIGPACAGALIAFLSAPGAVAVDAVSFAAASVLALFLPSPPKLPSSPHRKSIYAHLQGVFDTIISNRVLLRMICLAIVTNFCGAIFGGLEPLFIVRQLDVTVIGFGLALAAGGIGAMIGSFLASSVSKHIDVDKLMDLAVLFIIVALSGTSLLNGHPTTITILFGLFCFIAGFSSALITLSLVTYIQEAIPRDMLAKAIGVLMTCFGIMSPVGALAGGILAEFIGVRHTLNASIVAMTIVFIAVFASRGRQGANIELPKAPTH